MCGGGDMTGGGGKEVWRWCGGGLAGECERLCVFCLRLCFWVRLSVCSGMCVFVNVSVSVSFYVFVRLDARAARACNKSGKCDARFGRGVQMGCSDLLKMHNRESVHPILVCLRLHQLEDDFEASGPAQETPRKKQELGLTT